MQDGRFVAGAGSSEMELCRRIAEYGSQCPGLEQYAISKFADSLKEFPKVSIYSITSFDNDKYIKFYKNIK